MSMALESLTKTLARSKYQKKGKKKKAAIVTKKEQILIYLGRIKEHIYDPIYIDIIIMCYKLVKVNYGNKTARNLTNEDQRIA